MFLLDGGALVDARKVATELARVLKPTGGRLLCVSGDQPELRMESMERISTREVAWEIVAFHDISDPSAQFQAYLYAYAARYGELGG